MSIFKKGIEQSKEIEKSKKLCEERDRLEKKWPEINKQWEAEDAGPVRAAAQELAIVSLTQNRETTLKANETLRLALWRRDGIKESYQREFDRLSAEIEIINGPVIFDKFTEWTKESKNLGGKKLIQKIREKHQIDGKVMAIFKSNLDKVREAGERLMAAISSLRAMRQGPLGEILGFIEKIEHELGAIDFSILGKEEEVPEWKFLEISEQVTMNFLETHRIEPGYDINHMVIIKSPGTAGITHETAFKED